MTKKEKDKPGTIPDTGDTAEITDVTTPPTSAPDENPNLPEIDRARLGTLLRDGQRLAQHLRTKVHAPELMNWARDTQQFINEFGL